MRGIGIGQYGDIDIHAPVLRNEEDGCESAYPILNVDDTDTDRARAVARVLGAGRDPRSRAGRAVAA